MAMSKLRTMKEAIAELVPDGASVALGLQLEQMIPFAAGHEIIRQKKRGLTLIGPISDMLFDQIIAAGCVEQVIAACVGNVMMGSAYNFRRAVEQDGMKVFNMSNFTVALALQAGAMGVPFLPTKTALGSDLAKGNHFFYQIFSPFEPEEIVEPEVIASDPNRTVIPGFLVNAVVECRYGAHPSPVQGYYKRDDAFFRQYHEQTKTKADTDAWLNRWVYGMNDRRAYVNQLGACRVEELGVKQHAYAAQTDFGY